MRPALHQIVYLRRNLPDSPFHKKRSTFSFTSSDLSHMPHPNEPVETSESFEQKLPELADRELMITNLIRDEQAMMARSRTLYDEYIVAHQRAHQLIIDHLKAAMEARRALRECQKANTELQQRRQALHRQRFLG
ncbi:hypothetical protein C8R41DRAFT_925787 [Lentinula lateritia]|uniref:Uncharacterized protein n=1 Tax=Lentinula lateritia TaxID=40482 RepID=A0ABQ8V1D6_9AGAR|nr:hypothetical protein C8R41DRAFT_925787 [Lentinula lateritia]